MAVPNRLVKESGVSRAALNSTLVAQGCKVYPRSKDECEAVHADLDRTVAMIARAAKATGESTKARQAYEKLVTLASADPDRPELAEAKAFPAN